MATTAVQFARRHKVVTALGGLVLFGGVSNALDGSSSADSKAADARPAVSARASSTPTQQSVTPSAAAAPIATAVRPMLSKVLANVAPKPKPVIKPKPVAPPNPAAKPKPVAKPAPAVKTDPEFDTCKEAKANGYGPYYAGQDLEYDWYNDRDGDGVVCE